MTDANREPKEFGTNKQLVRESEWLRVYRLGPNHLHYESKFLTDELQVNVEQLKSRWSTFTAEEKRDFVQAYAATSMRSTDDHGILRFLMKVGPEETWGWLADRFTDLPEKQLVLEFLLERLKSDDGYFPNYAQALEVLGDTRAVSVLAEQFASLKHKIAGLSGAIGELPSESLFDCVSYLYCCRALIKLSPSSEAHAALEAMQTFPDERVSSMAKRLSLTK
jgi:hypothetical protein